MEWIGGGSLYDCLAEGSLEDNPIAKAGIILRIVEALAVAHENGIIHNDVKPKNILVNTQTKKHKLIDWGAAHMKEEEEITQTFNGLFVLTEGYAHPKIHVDPTMRTKPLADLYSVGKILSIDLLVKNNQYLDRICQSLLNDKFQSAIDAASFIAYCIEKMKDPSISVQQELDVVHNNSFDIEGYIKKEEIDPLPILLGLLLGGLIIGGIAVAAVAINDSSQKKKTTKGINPKE